MQSVTSCLGETLKEKQFGLSEQWIGSGRKDKTSKLNQSMEKYGPVWVRILYFFLGPYQLTILYSSVYMSIGSKFLKINCKKKKLKRLEKMGHSVRNNYY